MFYREDILELKKDLNIKVNLLENDLYFKTRWGVFSPRCIDEGTELLIKHININFGNSFLDLGCGYGVIGIAIAKKFSQARVDMLDKDFIAVELANINIEINKLDNIKAYLSDGLINVQNGIKFDHIVSNLPAKVGREQLSIMLYDAFDYLNIGGRITFVTINGLRNFIKMNFTSVFGNYKKLKQGQKYTVAEAVKTG